MVHGGQKLIMQVEVDVNACKLFCLTIIMTIFMNYFIASIIEAVVLSFNL